MVIDQPGSVVRSGGEGILAKLNQLRTKYALLANTRRITAPIAQKTGFPEGLILRSIRVNLPGPSLLLIVEARTPIMAQSRVIADATAQELIGLVKAEMDALSDIKPEDRIILSVASPAQPGVQVLPTRGRATTVGWLAGLLAFAATIALVETIGAVRRSR